MGQRFQIFIKTDNRMYGYHLQWCWGEHSIIRGYQLLDYFKHNLKYEFAPHKLNRRYGDVNDLFKSLCGYNTKLRSYVKACDLVDDFRTYDYENQRYKDDYEEAYLKFEQTPVNHYDNNDGILVIDARNNKLKYCYYVDCIYDYVNDECIDEEVVLTAREYLELYRKKDKTEEDKKEQYIKEKHLKLFDKIELLTIEDLINDFNLSKIGGQADEN